MRAFLPPAKHEEIGLIRMNIKFYLQYSMVFGEISVCYFGYSLLLVLTLRVKFGCDINLIVTEYIIVVIFLFLEVLMCN